MGEGLQPSEMIAAEIARRAEIMNSLEGENIYTYLDNHGDDPDAMLEWTRHVMAQTESGRLADNDIVQGLGRAWRYDECKHSILAHTQYWPRELRDSLIRQIENAIVLAQKLEGHSSKKGKANRMGAINVQPLALEWLWKPYLVRGMLAMLDGDPGVGKSLFTCTLAAAISRGWPLPDQQGKMQQACAAASVLFLSAEDSLAHTIVPRLNAAQADLSRIEFITGVYGSEDEEIPYTLQNINALHEAMADMQPALVIIDPLQAYLGQINMNRANETRPLMMALAKLAEMHRTCILCVRHPAKPGADGAKALHRGLGSIDIIGAARTALFIDGHPTEPAKALLMQSKSNVSAKGRTQIFSKAEGGFQWCGVTRADAELLAGNRRGPDAYALIEAFFWLERELGSGIPQPGPDIEARAKDEGGWSPSTLRRARKALGVVMRRVDGVWMWRLPSLEILLNHEPIVMVPNSAPITDTYRENEDNELSDKTRLSRTEGGSITLTSNNNDDIDNNVVSRLSGYNTDKTKSYKDSDQDSLDNLESKGAQERGYSVVEENEQKEDSARPGYTGRYRLPSAEQADLDTLFQDEL